MTRLSSSLISTSHFRLPVPYLYLAVGAASLGSLFILRSVSKLSRVDSPRPIPSPKETLIPGLSEDDAKRLPYPPDALPGARDVDSPYGSIRVYEWGPEDGERILLIHGISTPSIAFADLACKLVGNGCRVMLFDLFGRGYSSAPSPTHHTYSSPLYTSQILLCLSSSPLPWQSFTLIGYSLGGALAADFTSYFPHLIRGLILVAPGGLMRAEHVSWNSKLLYESGGWVPEWLVEKMVAARLWSGDSSSGNNGSVENKPAAVENAETTTTTTNAPTSSQTNPVYLSSHHTLLPSNPNSTVSAVVNWQITHHAGFIPAFISSIRHAPIHDQHARWRIIRENIESGTGPLKHVWLVLGATDPIIIAEELVHDAAGVLGEGNLRVRIVQGMGHEVAIERAGEVVDVVGGVLSKGW